MSLQMRSFPKIQLFKVFFFFKNLFLSKNAFNIAIIRV